MELLDLDASKVRVVKGKRCHRGLTYYDVSLHGKPLRFVLFSPPLGTGVHHKPSASNGAEQRLDVLFEVDTARRRAFEALETAVREQMDFVGVWSSAARFQGPRHCVKAKLNLSGAKETSIGGGLPDAWPQMAFRVVLQVHTAYCSERFAGLVVETVSVDFKAMRRVDVLLRHWRSAGRPTSEPSGSEARGPLFRYFRPSRR